MKPPRNSFSFVKDIGPLYKREITTIFINRMRLGRLRPVTQYCVFKKRRAWISFVWQAKCNKNHRRNMTALRQTASISGVILRHAPAIYRLKHSRYTTPEKTQYDALLERNREQRSRVTCRPRVVPFLSWLLQTLWLAGKGFSMSWKRFCRL